MGLFTPKWLKKKLESDTDYEKLLNARGFTISKKVFQYPNIYVDDEHKKFALGDRDRIYSYSDLLDFSGNETTTAVFDKQKGSTGKAIIGGMAFGTTGAVIGANMKKAPSQHTITQADINIVLNDITDPQITFHFYDGREQYDSNGNKVLTERKIEEVKGILGYIKANQPTKEKLQPSANLSGNIPALIKQLSELREQNVLTEEEFQSKKAELLAKV